MGIRFLKIYEINHWERKSSELFQKSINVCRKEKHEASGYPDDSYANDFEKQIQYIDDVKIQYGIEFEREKICKNATARNSAKLAANNQWGKLGQRSNLLKTIFAYSYCDYMKKALDKSLDIVGERNFPESDMVMASFVENGLKKVNPRLTSTSIAAMVTTYARQRLLKIFREINSVRPNRLLYADTNSVMFVQYSADHSIEQCGPSWRSYDKRNN